MLNLKTLKKYMLAKPETTEEVPFGPQALVFKVKGKMFAIVAYREDPLSISLKCDPEEAVLLRGQYPAITPGYHLNKQHWNSILLDGSIPDDEILEMIDDSFELVVEKMPKRDQKRLRGKEEHSFNHD